MSTRCARSGQLLRDIVSPKRRCGGRSDEEGVRAHLAEIAGAAKAIAEDIGGARAGSGMRSKSAARQTIYRARTHPPAPRYVTRVPHPRFDYEFALLPSQKYILQNHISPITS